MTPKCSAGCLHEGSFAIGSELTLISRDSKCLHWSINQSGELWKSDVFGVLPVVRLTMSPVDLRDHYEFLLLWKSIIVKISSVLCTYVFEGYFSRKDQGQLLLTL